MVALTKRHSSDSVSLFLPESRSGYSSDDSFLLVGVRTAMGVHTMVGVHTKVRVHTLVNVHTVVSESGAKESDKV